MAVRLIRRYPGYAAVVVFTLGLGIGGVSAAFTLADPMIFRRLPIVDSDRVVELRARVKDSVTSRLHLDDYVAIQTQSKTLENVSTIGGLLVGRFRGGPDVLSGAGVDQKFLPLSGLTPAAGRFFREEDFDASARESPRVALLTWGLWQSAFGGRVDAVGQRLELGTPDSVSMEIVGVLPREFFYPETGNEAPKFIVPWPPDPSYLGRANVYPRILARVRQGVGFAQVEAELDPLLAAVQRANPTFPPDRRSRIIPLQDMLFGNMRSPLLLLFTATGCLLMLAVVNLTHLAQARARARAKDVAISLAVGADRWRITRQMVVEASVLCLGGSLTGMAIGSVLFSWGMDRTPEFSHIYRLLPAGPGLRVFGLAVALSFLGIAALGFWPAWRASRTDLRSLLVTLPGRRRGWRIGSEPLAIAGQTAFAVGLVVVSLPVVRSFVLLVTKERGFDPAGVRLAGVQLPMDSPAGAAQRYQRLVEELSRVPGVRAAAVGNGVPMLTLPEGLIDSSGASIKNVVAFEMSGRFVAALDARLEEGRLFDDREAFATAPVAIVDRTAADLIWPGENPLGKTLRLRSGRGAAVVGVIARLHRNFNDDAPDGSAFFSIDTTSPAVMSRLMTFLRFDERRPPGDAALAEAARRADPSIVWRTTRIMTSWERLVGEPRFLASALGVLGTLTTLMAVFGILAVVGHLVSRRTREIGIRMALGATRSRVRWLVLRQVLAPAALGCSVGLVLAYWWSAAVRSVIIGIGPHDPWSFGVAVILTLAVVVAASLHPAMRASRIDPAGTLRAE